MVEGERLTAKQADALREELAGLEGPRREEIVAAIKKAREFGDLSENFEYHAAKNEQGLLEARIRTLRSRLDGARIVDEASGDAVGIGSVIDVEDDAGQTMTVEISAVGGHLGLAHRRRRLDVEDDAGQTMTVEISAVGGAGTVSPTSPLGAALLGRTVGETVDVQAPRGAWRATVKRIQ